MIVVIAMLAGIYDVASLTLIFAMNASMILFGWLMELHNQTTARTNWTAYWFGCLAGAVPWIAIAVYLAGAADPPAFVYAIFASLFLFFNVFAVNMLPAVPEGWSVARLPLRRAGLHAPEPVRQVGARLAGVRRNSAAGLAVDKRHDRFTHESVVGTETLAYRAGSRRARPRVRSRPEVDHGPAGRHTWFGTSQWRHVELTSS
jgi:hypothetical protein